VRLYESQTVADAGANAVAQGNNIAFAPGKLDFSSFGGQALLGHELSHVVSQQRGEVTGGGFLNDHALEARADREGAMAARGESVYGGATAPLSTASAAAAAGPMQAKREKADPVKEQIENEDMRLIRDMESKNQTRGFNDMYVMKGAEGYDDLDPEEYEEHTHKAGFFSKLFGRDKNRTYKRRRQLLNPAAAMLPADTEPGEDPTGDMTAIQEEYYNNKHKFNDASHEYFGRGKLAERLLNKYQNSGQYKNYQEHLHRNEVKFANIQNPDGTESPNPRNEEGLRITGLVPSRLTADLLHDRGRGFHMKDEEVEGLLDKLMAPNRRVQDGVDEEGNAKYRDMNDEEKVEANKQFDQGMQQYKEILYGDLKGMEKDYGTTITQMHPRDVMNQLTGARGYKYEKQLRSTQDMFQIMASGQRYFDENNEKDKDFKKLVKYYGDNSIFNAQFTSLVGQDNNNGGEDVGEMLGTENQATAAEERKINGPKMSPEQEKEYRANLRERMKAAGHGNELFGKFGKVELPDIDKSALKRSPTMGPRRKKLLD
ncbi:MAG: DUF4157 domain-containing protein, partial [Oscillospiraceae bacterium]|nr:DUF4157 domain-containing protein [Oscillospiraceae bacterium]